MLSEPMTLYKLMNLYMLKQVNFPLTNAQLTDFFLQHVKRRGNGTRHLIG